MVTINSTLEDIMQLDFTSREMILEILQKRQIEASRELIADHAKNSLKQYRSGKLKAFSLEETLNQLNAL